MLNKQWIQESRDRKRSVWDWSRFGWHFKSGDQGTNVKGPFREDAEMEESLVIIDEGTRVVLCTGPPEMHIRKGRRVHKERWGKAKDKLFFPLSAYLMASLFLPGLGTQVSLNIKNS